MTGDRLAFEWARSYDADQLAAFIEDLWGAASGDNDLATLDAIEQAVSEHRPPLKPCPLTDRELEILTELASGETYEGAARNLGIGRDSVRARCPNIYARLGAKNGVQAAAIAERQGWLAGLHLPTPPTSPGCGPISWPQIYRAQAAQLRRHPGRVAEFGPYRSRTAARRAASRIRRGVYEPFQPAGAFGAEFTGTEYGGWLVHAHYRGTTSITTSGSTT
ncbi:response regulator transcription factor [Streptomyces chartreusis]|uniref:response regulator transcription factor n=1 Tax=Streptomyces chartreusis TaxID=1969 RepID=UPI00382701E5